VELMLDFLRPTPSTTQEQGDRRVLRRGLVERLFRGLAEARPLLVLMEDLHMATGRDVEIIEHLLASLRVNPAPIYVVASMRPISKESKRPRIRLDRLMRFQGAELTRITLKPLPEAAIRTIIQLVAPDAVGRAKEIWERCHGNALFAVQIGRHLGQMGSESEELPEDLHETLRTRLDAALADRQDAARLRGVLLRCALLGDPIRVSVLEALLVEEGLDQQQQAMLHEDLDLLVERGMLRDIPRSDGELLNFDHGLLREHVLATAGERRARRIHAALAKVLAVPVAENALETMNMDDAARHAVAAGDAMQARELLKEAGEQALNSGAYERAVQHFEQLAGYADTDDPQMRALALDGLATALIRLGDLDEAGPALQRLAAEPSASHRVSALSGLARIAIYRNQFTQARALLAEANRAVQVWSNPADRALQIVRLINADLQLRQGHYVSVAGTLRPILARPAEQELMLDAVRLMGLGLMRLGEFKGARTAFVAAHKLATRRGERLHALRIAFLQAENERLAGRIFDAVRIVDDQRRWVDAVGRPELEAELMLADGEQALEQQQFDLAESEFRRSIEVLGTYNIDRTNQARYNLVQAVREGKGLAAATVELKELMAAQATLGWLEGPTVLLLARYALESGNQAQADLALRRERSLKTAVVDPRVARTLEAVGAMLAGGKHIFDARENLARAQSLWRHLGREQDARRCGILRDQAGEPE